MRKTGLMTLLMSAAFIAGAQQSPLLNHYYVNPFLVNPASAGEFGTNMYLLNRSQWMDVQGAPQTFVATIDGMVGKTKLGYGLTFSNDVVNIVGKTSIYGTYAYKLPLFKDAQLAFGLSIGFEQNRLLFDRVQAANPVEVTLINNVVNQSNFDANSSFMFTWKNLNFGGAAFQLLNNRNTFSDQVNQRDYIYAFNRHYVSTLRYRVEIEENKLYLDPYIQGRYAFHIAPQFDMNMMLNWADQAWIGGGYRTGFGANVMIGGVLGRHLVGSYSYGQSIGTLQKLSANSHEFMIGYKFDGVVNRKDSDHDGVVDAIDKEPNTPEGCEVNEFGVAHDDDRDGVPNCKDHELTTPLGSKVDENGVALDGDGDGVPDLFDREMDTPKGCTVDKVGVALDTDFDGVPDCIDKEMKTPIGAPVDADGIALDADKDLVPDFYDLEPNTPHWEHVGSDPSVTAAKCIVDKHGVALDSDGDGITDCVDKEPNTPRGALVDKFGISIDTDHDGVPDGLDVEVDSPRGAKVDKWGRSLPNGNKADDDGDGVPNSVDLEPNTPKGKKVDEYGRAEKPANPVTANKLEIQDMVDNDTEWDYYMIVGVFRIQSNVKGYQEKLKNKYGEPTKVLVTEAGYYYVWTKKVTTKEEAYKEADRLKNKNIEDFIVGNPWLWREAK